ncbi:helix-turn-helix domain-containing protein [Maribacter sp. 2304DJ31-5]|uniref:helix-turn-helix domain-containing protein n=1 Tax=Maribacter sp. 2304DJ31-5 TaxID=3386273 RepID=UPI0039BCA452
MYIFYFYAMLITDKLADSGDPSKDAQEFKHLKLKLLCCRYWWFEIWKGQRMSFPYWRLYWNKNEGGYILYNEKIDLKPDHFYLISPHTPYSTGINHQKPTEESDYFYKCGRINSEQEEKYNLQNGNLLHFFIHFTLGADYDNVHPGVYPVEKTEERTNNLHRVLELLVKGSKSFSSKESLDVYNLILSSLGSVMPYLKTSDNINYKIASTIDFMEKNINTKMTDKTLAKNMHLSTGSFSRLFKRDTGVSPSRYLRKIRIEKACNLLLYTDNSIDLIADKCGFSDRYHLTKVFRMEKKTSPAAFRKSNGYF